MSVQTKKKDDSPSDMMVQKFQEAMNKIASFDARLESLVQTISMVMQKLDGLSKKHDKLEEFSKESNQVIGAALHSDKIGNQKNELQLNWISTAVKNLDEDLKQFSSKIPEFNSQISQIKKDLTNFSSIDLVNSIKKDFTNLETYVKNRHLDFQDQINDGKVKQAATRDVSNSNSSEVANIHKKIKEFEAKINNLSGDLGLSKSYTDSQINHNEIVLKKYVDSSIESIPKPVIPSLDDARKAMDDKVQPAVLDAKNANIRSDNNEKKIYILEKKVEQLQLLINKLQLGG